jgi:hypothetical protein
MQQHWSHVEFMTLLLIEFADDGLISADRQMLAGVWAPLENLVNY